MKIFITGVRGFLGTAMATFFNSLGHTVVGSVSSQDSLEKGAPAGCRKLIVMPLGVDVDSRVLKDVDVLIHNAFDFSPNSAQINLQGIKQHYRAAREQGIKQQIFISSISARSDSISSYGKEKWQVEGLFTDPTDQIVRPGLVVGRGGLYGRMLNLVARLPLIPLFDGGKSPVHCIAISDLLISIQKIMQLSNHSAANAPQTWNLYYPRSISLASHLKIAARATHKKRVFIPLPSTPVIAILRLMETLSLKLPVSSQNVIGMAQNEKLAIESDLPHLLPTTRPIEEIVSKIAAEG